MVTCQLARFSLNVLAKNLHVLYFAMNSKPRAHSLIPINKKGVKSPSWDRKTHKCEFKMMAIYTNQQREWLEQIEGKMVHGWNYNKHSYNSSYFRLVRSHQFPQIIYSMIGKIMITLKWQKKPWDSWKKNISIWWILQSSWIIILTYGH